MSKTKKIQRNLFLFIKLILFLGVLYLLYRQLSRVDISDWKTIKISSIISLVCAIILVIPNIGIAYLKWRITLHAIAVKVRPQISIHSFFAGIVTGLLTPNMLGNFIGRLYYFESSKRPLITALTMFCNFGQFMASFMFGWVSLLVVGNVYGWERSDVLIMSIGGVILISILIFFYAEHTLLKIWKKPFAKELNLILRKDRLYRWKILFLSFGRFLIFTTQYTLVLHAFGQPLTIQMILGIWQVYLVTMIFPSLILGKLGVKEVIGVTILGTIGCNEFAIVISSLLIWTLNSLSPALVGLILCRKPAV